MLNFNYESRDLSCLFKILYTYSSKWGFSLNVQDVLNFGLLVLFFWFSRCLCPFNIEYFYIDYYQLMSCSLKSDVN